MIIAPEPFVPRELLYRIDGEVLEFLTKTDFVDLMFLDPVFALYAKAHGRDPVASSVIARGQIGGEFFEMRNYNRVTVNMLPGDLEGQLRHWTAVANLAQESGTVSPRVLDGLKHGIRPWGYTSWQP